MEELTNENGRDQEVWADLCGVARDDCDGDGFDYLFLTKRM